METSANAIHAGRFNPLNDFLFFKVMGEKGDETQLLGFLNAVLCRSGEYPIQSVEIQDNQSFEADIASGKSCVLDVLAILSSGTKVNIEIQLKNQGNMQRRSLFYWSKVFSEGLDEGQDYQELPKVISINIIDFSFLPGSKFHTRFHIREDSDSAIILSNALEIHFINMAKWRKLKDKDIKDNVLHRWLTWFDERSPPELIEEVVNMDTAIKAADERQSYITQSEEARRTYWSRRKAEHDRVSGLNYATQKGMKKGLKQGHDKATLNIARNALAEGASLEFVQKITGLDVETIRKLL